MPRGYRSLRAKMSTSRRGKDASRKERTESLQSNRLNVLVALDSSTPRFALFGVMSPSPVHENSLRHQTASVADSFRCCFSKLLVIAAINQSLKRSGKKVDMNINGLAWAPTT